MPFLIFSHSTCHNITNSLCSVLYYSFYLLCSYIENTKMAVSQCPSRDNDDYGNRENSSDLTSTSNVEVIGLTNVLDGRERNKSSTSSTFWTKTIRYFCSLFEFSLFVCFCCYHSTIYPEIKRMKKCVNFGEISKSSWKTRTLNKSLWRERPGDQEGTARRREENEESGKLLRYWRPRK